MSTEASESNDTLALSKSQNRAAVPAGNQGLTFTDMEGMWRFCVAVVNSGTFKDINTPEIALIRLQAGLELGLTPIWSLTNILVVNGRPSVWGDALLGLVLNHPDCEDVVEEFDGDDITNDDTAAVCTVKRKGRMPVKRRFSVRDAKLGGLWKKAGPWSQYPLRMLQMRARSWACRDSFADVLRGLAVVEELRDVTPFVNGNGGPQKEAPKLVLPDDPPAGETRDKPKKGKGKKAEELELV